MREIKITGVTDQERTISLKRELDLMGHSSIGYEWLDGEIWYHGHPTAGFFEKLKISINVII